MSEEDPSATRPSTVAGQRAQEHDGDLLDQIVCALLRGLGEGLRAVVLFGSRARGDHHPDSDWDLLVIAERLGSRPFERYQNLKRMLPDHARGVAAMLAVTPTEFEARLSEPYLDIGLDGLAVFDPTGYAERKLAELRRIIARSGLHRERMAAGDSWQWRDPPPAGRWSVEWEG